MKGDHVAHNVHGGHAGVARARNGLHGGGDHLRDAERLEGREAHGEHHRGAIGVGDDLAFPAAGALLPGNQPQVIGIDLGNQQRHIEFHAMVAGVGDHDVAGLGEGALDFGGDRRVHGGEQQLRGVAGPAIFHGETGDGRRCAAGEVPRHGVGVLLAGGAVAGAQPREMEPRVALEELDEMLAHHSGGAQDAYFDSRLHKCLTMR